MQELFRQLMTIVRGMWQRRWIGLGVAWVVAVLSVMALLRLPDRFEVNARIFVDTQSVLKPLMSGLAVQPDVNQQIAMLARTLITRPNIEKLIQDADLNIMVKNDREREQLIDDLTKNIKLNSSGRENLYIVTYRDTSKDRALRVAQTLVSMFVESGLGGKRRDAEGARKFIDEQIQTYEKKLEEAENRLKEFKLKNLAYSSGTGQDYFARMSALNDEMAKLRLELRVAEQSRDALKRELAGEEPILLPEPQAVAASQLPEIDARIETMKKQLDDLLRRYTDQHPDVISTRRAIDQLEQQKRVELEARKKLLAGSRGSAATNPVFQRIKISLTEAETNVAALRTRVTETQARLDQLRAAAGRIPQVETEMAQLNRDYEVLRKNYEALVARRESAAISEDVDATARLAEFRVIDPPRVTPTPVFPNRASLAPLALLAAIAAGGAACFAVAQLFPAIYNARDLRQLAQRPVLGTVSLRLDTAARRQRRFNQAAFFAGLASLVLVYSSWIVWLTWQART